MPSYDDALTLFHEWTLTDSLRRHAYAVEAAMGFYAQKLGEDVELWRMTGLLHDMDYEKHQTLDEHPFVGVGILRDAGYPEVLCDAILGHAEHTGHPRTTLMAKVLFALDELAGFITAVGYVRPTGLTGMNPKSVTKKLKDKNFAAAVSRDDIRNGAADLDMELNEHIANVIAGMQADATRIGFPPSE